MAKKKPSSNNSEDDRVVLDYLRKVNRPYSATDIFNNLHGKYQKTNIVKALERLVDQDEVVSKTYGKISIYVVKQKKEDMPSAEEINDINTELETLTEELESLKNTINQLNTELSMLTSAPTTAEGQEQCKQLLEQNAAYKARLEELKSGTAPIPVEQRKKIDTEYDRMCKEWRMRRKLFREIFGTIMEHIPGDVEALKEEIGIEDDPVSYEESTLAL